MTWTRLSSDALEDPALASLPRGTRLLHVEALLYANRHGTDGLIPRHAIRRISDERHLETAVQRLVDAGVWSEFEHGWTIVGFLDEQPSAADIGRIQALARERQRRQRQHRNGDHSLCDPKYCQAASRATSRATSRVTDAVSHDTRTDPPRPTRSERTGSGGGDREDGPNAPRADGAEHRPPPDGEKNWRKTGPTSYVVDTA